MLYNNYSLYASSTFLRSRDTIQHTLEELSVKLTSLPYGAITVYSHIIFVLKHIHIYYKYILIYNVQRFFPTIEQYFLYEPRPSWVHSVFLYTDWFILTQKKFINSTLEIFPTTYSEFRYIYKSYKYRRTTRLHTVLDENPLFILYRWSKIRLSIQISCNKWYQCYLLLFSTMSSQYSPLNNTPST